MTARPYRRRWFALAVTTSAAICLLTVALLATARSSQGERVSDQMVVHTHEVSDTLRDVLAHVKDAEIGQRGYLLTGNPRYLAPFEHGRRLAPADLDRLQLLTRNSPLQQQHAASLRPLVVTKIGEMQQTVQLYETGQARRALSIVNTDRGQHLMDSIRAQVSQMQAEQSRLLSLHIAASEASSHQMLLWVSGVIALAIVLLSVSGGSVAILMMRQAQAEERIRDYNVLLEFQKDQLKIVNAELETLATTDGLTYLSNHRTFQERLAEEVLRAARYGTPLSLIILDVDYFKRYNDAFGHPAGDEVLRRMGLLLRETARESDLVARYGGEEFALVFPQTNEGGAAIIAERIRKGIETAPWPRRNITASFGVSTLGLGMDADDLIECADQALYRAKKAGRNRIAQADVQDGYETHEMVDSPREGMTEAREAKA